MAANQKPIFPVAPRVASCLVGASALTARTAIAGTTGLTALATSGANGSRWDRIQVKGTGATLAGQLDIWIYDGTTSRLYKSFKLQGVTPSTTVDAEEQYLDINLALPSTHSLYCSSQVASQLASVFAIGGDY